MDRIIQSILDTDLYKFTMQQAVVKKFPCAKVRYKLIVRSDVKFHNTMKLMLMDHIKYMSELGLTGNEKEWLRGNCYFLDPTYLDFLEGYRYDPNEVQIKQVDGNLEIIIEGYWYRTILWEVPLMALISELHFKLSGEHPWSTNVRRENNKDKATILRSAGCHFADMGTRRRFSFDIQDEFVGQMAAISSANFVGTSNVYLAFKHNVKCMGTQAHEWFMFMAAKYGYKMANHMSMQYWTDVYRGDLGIALSDTLTSEIFFQSFDKMFAKLYDGVRHDSGDPFEFTDKVIAHYNKLGIDPKTKVIIFSDSLNVDLAVKIKEYCRGKIKCSFGIGTHFTNDVGVIPLNMVIKMFEAKPEGEDWHPVIKLSDDKGKHTGDDHEIIVAKDVLGIEKI